APRGCSRRGSSNGREAQGIYKQHCRDERSEGRKRVTMETSMVRYYAERAAEYERIYAKPERQEDLRQLRGFVERTFAGANVFEIACGTGCWTEVVARSAASVVATDINEEVLAIARSKTMDRERTTIRKADAYALTPGPERFT